jgi:hypothetical protein
VFQNFEKVFRPRLFKNAQQVCIFQQPAMSKKKHPGTTNVDPGCPFFIPVIYGHVPFRDEHACVQAGLLTCGYADSLRLRLLAASSRPPMA